MSFVRTTIMLSRYSRRRRCRRHHSSATYYDCSNRYLNSSSRSLSRSSTASMQNPVPPPPLESIPHSAPSTSTLSTQELLQLDRQHVWHPYAAAGPSAFSTSSNTSNGTSNVYNMDHVVPIESAHNVYLKVRRGSSYDRYDTQHPTTTTTTATNNTTHNEAHHLLVDGMSNWWATIHGYQHPTLNDAIYNQVSKMSHVMFGGITHESAIQLCTKLCQLTKLDICFLSDSGSVAIEVAMKMSIQYWSGRKRRCMNTSDTTNSYNTNYKNKFITVQNGYHGDTFMAMSVCDPVNGMHTKYFDTLLQQQIFIKTPSPIYPNSELSLHTNNNNDDDINNEEVFDESHVQELKQTLEVHHMSIAAMILEPIVQGAGGMKFYSPLYLRRIRELCTQYDILLIYDEIATGFGRTGHMFGHEHCYNNDNNNNVDVDNNDINHKYKPDIICLGKALTGGYMSLAATITSNHVADMIHYVSTTDQTQQSRPVLMHGPTFMGNPLACSVALASISLLESSKPPLPTATTKTNTTNIATKDIPLPQHTSTCTDWRRSIPMIQNQLRTELIECLESKEIVKSVRVLGGIGVIELHDPIVNPKLFQHTVVKDYNVWLRPFGKLIYTMPSYIINSEQLRQITYAMVQLTKQRF